MDRQEQEALPGAGGMAQWYRPLPAFPEDLGLIFSPHVRWLTLSVTAAPGYLVPLASIGTDIHKPSYRHAHTQLKIKYPKRV